jgi:hypothetical protein
MRNTQIEKSLNRKMHPQYLGLLIVITQNFSGAYILCELDRSVLHHPVAAFRLLPYLMRKSIPLPPNFLDIDEERLKALRNTSKIDDDLNEELPDDYAIPEHD